MPRPRACVAAVACGALILLAAPARADTTEEQIDRTRAQISDVAQQWFEHQNDAASIDAQIAELEQQVADARAEADRRAEIATAQAVELYTGSTATGFGPVLVDANGALETARAAELLDRADDDAQRAIDELTAAANDLDARLEELAAQREAQLRVTEELTKQQAELDAQLDALEAQAQREADAARAAEAAKPKPRATKVAAPTAQSNAAAPAPAPAPAAAPAAAAPAPPSAGEHPRHNEPFLVCTRQRESNGQYNAVNPSGYYGAYQFAPTTWDVTASRAGRLELVGVLPSRASAYDQDDLAWVLYQWQGNRPWGGRC